MRFELIENNPNFPNDGETCWYWDSKRPLPLDSDGQPYIAVECYCKAGDPNQFVRHEKLYLFFVDQAEYYAICENCYLAFKDMQWSGHTQNPGWRRKSQLHLSAHLREKGWCELCDPFFGGGGLL